MVDRLPFKEAGVERVHQLSFKFSLSSFLPFFVLFSALSSSSLLFSPFLSHLTLLLVSFAYFVSLLHFFHSFLVFLLLCLLILYFASYLLSVCTLIPFFFSASSSAIDYSTYRPSDVQCPGQKTVFIT